eukprot:109767_1
MEMMEWQHLCAIVSIGLFVIVSILISAASLYYLYIQDSSSSINRMYRNLTMIVILSFTITIIGDWIHQIILFSNVDLFNAHAKYIRGFVDGSNEFAVILLYILLLVR